MKAEYTISFLSELLDLTEKLHSLVRDHCRLLAAEDQDGQVVEYDDQEDIPF